MPPRRGCGVHEGLRRFRCIAAAVDPPKQLEGDLRFVQAATPDNQRAVADHVAFSATTDREGTDPDLRREIPESCQARRRLFERRHLLPALGDQLSVPNCVALVAEPQGQPLGRSVAVWPPRPTVMLPVAVQVPVTGS